MRSVEVGRGMEVLTILCSSVAMLHIFKRSSCGSLENRWKCFGEESSAVIEDETSNVMIGELGAACLFFRLLILSEKSRHKRLRLPIPSTEMGHTSLASLPFWRSLAQVDLNSATALAGIDRSKFVNDSILESIQAATPKEISVIGLCRVS